MIEIKQFEKMNNSAMLQAPAFKILGQIGKSEVTNRTLTRNENMKRYERLNFGTFIPVCKHVYDLFAAFVFLVCFEFFSHLL